MKNITKILMGILLTFMVYSCLKDKPSTPVINTVSVTDITQTTATSGGEVIDEGGVPVVVRGVCWSTSPAPTTSDSKTTESGGAGSFASNITRLTPNTMYYIRAYATNSSATGYGNQVIFSTNSVLSPSLTTSEVTSITSTSVITGGNITDDGGASIIERGVCWGTHVYPTISDNKAVAGNGTGTFTSDISGLSTNTIYYLRAYAMNSSWTAYGNMVSFTPAQYYQVTDIEDNIYNAVTIGTQIWMKENLRSTKYNDGTSVPNITDNSGWAELTYAAYCWYDNDENYKATYGALYNWYTVNKTLNGNKNICPTGWHVPSGAEWAILQDYLMNNGYGYMGNQNFIGKSLASASGWLEYNSPGSAAYDQGSNNGSGFTGFPAGARCGSYQGDNFGVFYGLGSGGFWWSIIDTGNGGVFMIANRQIVYNGGDVINGDSQYANYGYSVRCLKDN